MVYKAFGLSRREEKGFIKGESEEEQKGMIRKIYKL